MTGARARANASSKHLNDKKLHQQEDAMKLTRLLLTLALVTALTHTQTPTAAAETATAGGASSPQAVLMSCSGPVTVHQSDGTTVSGSFGLALKAGDEVKTGEGGSAEIFFEAGNWLQIGPNSNITIKGQRGADAPVTAETPGDDPGKEVASFEVAQNFLKLKDAEGTSALTGLRSGDKDQDLVALSPSQTKIRDGQPTFRWEIADQSTELKLTVYNESGVHWEHDVSGVTSVDYPGDAPELSPGVTYSWTLETTDPLAFPPLRTTASFFEVIDSGILSKLDGTLGRIDGAEEMSESARHFMRASLYFDRGLLEDAIAETEIALEDDPDNPSLNTILARLYEEAGRAKDAMAIYRKLETLSE
jgi:tetratricopeptide (TPR) repeat protein